MVTIIGGGITGLSAAFELTRRQVPFVLLEASSRLGGLIHTEHIEGFTIDAGADSLLVQKPAALQLCAEVGLSPRLMCSTPPRTAFVLKGERLHALPSPSVLGIPTTAAGVARYDLLGWRARARLALEPLIPRRARTDQSVASFFARRFGGAAVNLIAEPLLGGIHAGHIDQLSMLSLFPRLVDAEQKPGKVLRTLGRDARPPADGLFRALGSGMSELVDAIAARVPQDCVRLNAPAQSLERQRPGWRIHAGGAAVDARAVIIAAPAFASAALLEPVDDGAARICEGVPYVSTAGVALGFRREDVGHPLAGSGFVVARRYSPLRITACTWVSSKWPLRAPEGHVLLRAFFGGAHDPAAAGEPDGVLVDTALRELTPILQIGASPVLTRVYRWPRTGAQHIVGHRAKMKALGERLRAHAGLYVAGSGFDAIGIPDCVAHGRRAAAAAADYVKSTPERP